MEENTEKSLENSKFALQIDETTDVIVKVELIAIIHENYIINHFFIVVSYLFLQMKNITRHI